jgi:hypothetical protein
MDAFWIAFYEFPEKFLGIKYKPEESKKLKIWSELAKSSSWFWAYENYCFVSDRPKSIHFNLNVRLHKTDGPAIEWIDGYKINYINGREISNENFNKALQNKITKEDWLNEKNEDVKGAWFEILGSEKVMKILEAKEIDSEIRVHSNGDIDDLKLYKTPFILPEIGEALAWVKFICPSTGTNYLISVNPKHNKVMDAVIESSPFYGQEIKSEKDYYFTQRG